MLRSRWSPLFLLAVWGCEAPNAERTVLAGDSPLVSVMHDAATEFDVPAEILAAVAWTETALIVREATLDEHHVPAAAGVMGLPERGAVRSVGAAAALLDVPRIEVQSDLRTNVRGAAALLRSLAPDDLDARGDRERWLTAVAKYFDAGAASENMAREVRRTIARGLATEDAAGLSFEIPSYAELYPERRPPGARRFALAAEYPGATWVAAHSSNYTNASRRNANIDVVVIHTTQGSYAGAISWFRNASSNVSAHYVIRASDGDVTQMVHHEDIGWHAGNTSYNGRSIGIEHEGDVRNPNAYTQAMLRSSANLTRWLCDNLGIPKDRSHIVAHSEVPGATHSDPGQYFPWSTYMAMVQNGSGTPPAPTDGLLQGVVYAGTDTTNRIVGATITLTPGGRTATARSPDGFWSFNVSPGTYTVSARATGYDVGTTMRTVGAGEEVWGSVSVTRSTTGGTTGQLKGVVYDATKPNLETRIAGARVRVSNGATQVVDATGAFSFDLAPGQYTVTAEKTGWTPSPVTRTVVANAIEWGSVGVVPENTVPTNSPPQVAALLSPVQGVVTRSTTPVFTIDGLIDPDNDPLTVEIQLFRDEALTQRVSDGTLAVAARQRLVSWKHPRDDLPRDDTIFWRVRAKDASSASPWSTVARFATPTSEDVPANPMGSFAATVLAGVGTNAPPGAATIVSPQDGQAVATARPQIEVGPASDPEGDALAYQFEVGADDLFTVVEALSPTADVSTWVVDRDLAPGGVYYVRARAADERVYGPWSSAVSFRIATDAATDPDSAGAGGDMGGDPTISADVESEGGCRAVQVRHRGAPWVVLLLLAGLVTRRRLH